MNKNKGFTLVELVVAVAVLVLVIAEIGSLMINSQRLYKNGYYEINLQENAQQAIQQVEDILVNVNVKDGITPTTKIVDSISSDVIAIETQEREINDLGFYTDTYTTHTYEIGRIVDFEDSGVTEMETAEDGSRYCDLILKKDGVNVGTIAKGVQSVYITKNSDIDTDSDDSMYNFSTADVITITVNMQNHSTKYSASGEVYLRNRIGTGGDNISISSTGSGADVDLTVLRIHTYNLNDFVEDGYGSFAFATTGLDAYYDLDSSTGELTCKPALNSSVGWNTEKEGLIYAYNGPNIQKISIHTPKVNDGVKVPIYSWGQTTAPIINAIPVDGICTCEDCAKDVVMDAEITLDLMPGTPVKTTWNNGEVVDGDLALYWGSENSGNFDIHLHADEMEDDGVTVEYHKGQSVPTGETPVRWINEIFCRSESGYLNTYDSTFYVCHYKKKGTEDKWDGKDPFTGEEYLTKNYTMATSGANVDGKAVKWPVPNEAGHWLSSYELKRIHVDNKANAFGLNTSNHSEKEKSKNYWNYIVDNGGYVRIHIWCKFEGLLDNVDNIYDCYGYYFPNNSGSEGQHDALLNRMNLSSFEPKPSLDDYTYYDAYTEP